jgi:hypothetical protein
MKLEEKKSTNATEPSAESITLVPQFITGLTEKIRDSIFFKDDANVIYPVGHNVCIYNIEDRTQRLIPGLEGSCKITALAVSHSKRYLAIAESTDKTPILCVYDLQTLKRRKLIASTEIKNASYISIGFSFSSNNEKMLVAMTDNEPD